MFVLAPGKFDMFYLKCCRLQVQSAACLVLFLSVSLHLALFLSVSIYGQPVLVKIGIT